MRLEEIVFRVTPDAPAVLLLYQAGWLGSAELIVLTWPPTFIWLRFES